MLGVDASKDFYRVLGVSSSASHDEIKHAFRELAKRYHPDRAPGNKKAEHRFKEINEAYTVVGDPEKRRRYDRLRLLGVGFSPDIEYGYDLNDLKEQLAAQMSGVRDFFSGIFDWAGRGGRGGVAEEPAGGSEEVEAAVEEETGTRGRDLTYRVSISLEKAMKGGKATFSVPALRGSERRRLGVEVPAGITEGKKIRLAGQGQPGRRGGAPGDLYLKVHILADGDFQMEDGRLVLRRDVDLRTLMLGGEIEVPTPGGFTRRLAVPALTRPGSRLELAEAAPGGRVLTVEIGADWPRELDDEARERFRAFCEAAGIGPDR